MFISKRRLGVLKKNITSIPWKIKNNISLSSILQESTIGVNVKIHPKVKFYRSRLGDFSYVGPNSYVADTEIGKFTSISQDCYIGGAAHPLHWTGSSLHFYCTNPNEEGVSGSGIRKTYFESFKKTSIGSDVWIGARVLVLAGVSVGDGAVIGAGSVVTKNIPPYEVWAGNPAKKINDRFAPEISRELQEIQWWNETAEKINSCVDGIKDPELFIELYRNQG